MKILVTGANGLLGQKLVALLSLRADITLIATGRGANRNPTSGYSYLECDLTDSNQVNHLFEQVRPDAIIHTAAMTQVDDCELNKEKCWRINVEAVQYLVEAARKRDSFFLYVSTDFVFDGKGGPYQEGDVCNPISYYGDSKLAAESLVKNSNLSWAIARTVLVYGVAHDMSRSNIVLWVKRSLEEKKPIKVVNDQWRTPTLVEDLAIGCAEIILRKAFGVFHLSGDEMMTPFELANRVAEHYGLDHALISAVDQSTFTQSGKRPPKTGFIIDKARAALNFQPRSFAEGLSLVAGQLVENG